MQHAKHPHNFFKPESTTHSAERFNPVCGDRLSVYLEVNGRTIRQAGFGGEGCAICVASASMLTDAVAGLSVADARSLATALESLLDGKAINEDLGELGALSAVRGYPSRVQCATLAWHALKTATEPLTQHS